MNFESLLQRKLKPPFVPILSSEIDTTNFDSEFTNCQVQSYEESPGNIYDDKFKDFEYGNE